uniref:ribosomal protein L9 n=1 Tax=Pulvinaster venetus TaxID=427767 RepID=UPI001FCD1EDC|nr:ribosomal protein L9 [Pulvinaster venetus]UNJ16917.1 ribosomal protein L9 [Pulvinaster venetus]
MPKKTINILLLKDEKNLGNMGSTQNVALGYARNYLLPRGIGCLITPKIQAEINKKIAIEKENNSKLIEKARKLQANLATINKLTIRKKVGINNLIFGSLTDKEISELIFKATGESIDKKYINVPNIKTTGIYEITVKLHQDITGQILLQVIPEDNS